MQIYFLFLCAQSKICKIQILPISVHTISGGMLCRRLEGEWGDRGCKIHLRLVKTRQNYASFQRDLTKLLQSTYNIQMMAFSYLYLHLNFCVWCWLNVQEWHDDKLRWEPSEYGGVEEIYVPRCFLLLLFLFCFSLFFCVDEIYVPRCFLLLLFLFFFSLFFLCGGDLWSKEFFDVFFVQ